MDSRLLKHLKVCKLDMKRFKKLMELTIKISASCDTTDQMVTKFADKCYRKEKDRKLAKIQARTYIDALFGSVDRVFKHGPEVAVRRLLSEQYPKSSDKKPKEQCPKSFNDHTKGNLIKVNMIEKKESSNVSTHLHEPEDKDFEAHPMWARRLKQYLVGPTLGVGATSKVKLAFDQNSRTKVALKILKPKYATSAKKEIDILKSLSHENIVQVYDCFSDVLWEGKKTTVFAIEYANQGELIDYLMYTSKFEDDLARWFFVSLTKGVEYCHSQNVVHRDLKHDNCLLGENFVLKITDFGFATYYEDEMMKTPIGTAKYAAPEILKGQKYTEAVDIFSMGVMLFVALAGTQPWHKASVKDRWFRMVRSGNWKKFFEYHERSHKFTVGQKTILKGLLDPNPENRWKLGDVKACTWFNGKKLSQEDVALRLKFRKRIVDETKYKAMQAGRVANRRVVDIFSTRLPYVYFQPIPLLSFITYKKAEWVLEHIANVIADLKGTITEEREKYKLKFHVTKVIETGNYIDKETKDKEYAKVRVCASVQMWTHPGQKKALEDRNKMLTAIAQNKNSIISDEARRAIVETVPKIKTIAIFRAEGGSHSRYLFPAIYSDILLSLPVDLISKSEVDGEINED